MATRPCPYCAEEIQAEAVLCRYCRSRLGAIDPAAWRRDHPERRVAGVAAAVAHGLAVPVSMVRLAFLVFAFIHFVGPMAYAALWLVIPAHAGAPSALERVLASVQALIESMLGSPPSSGGPTAPHVMPNEPHP